MRHRKHTFKIGRTSSHRRCLIANMLKSLIDKGQIETTLAKGKEIKRHADKIITLAKKQTLASKQLATGRLMIQRNPLTPKEARAAKNGDTSAYNTDRKVINTLFSTLADRFKDRKGGYTRLIKLGHRVGDGADMCIVEYLNEA